MARLTIPKIHRGKSASFKEGFLVAQDFCLNGTEPKGRPPYKRRSPEGEDWVLGARTALSYQYDALVEEADRYGADDPEQEAMHEYRDLKKHFFERVKMKGVTA